MENALVVPGPPIAGLVAFVLTWVAEGPDCGPATYSIFGNAVDRNHELKSARPTGSDDLG